MPTMKKGLPKVSPFAQMLRDKREKLAPNATLREFCSARGLEAALIEGMEHDRRTAPGTYGALYKLASGYGHGPTDRWTVALLDAALGKAPVQVRPAKSGARPTGRSIQQPASSRKPAKPVRAAGSSTGRSTRAVGSGGR